MSIRQLAEKAGVSRMAINRLENGIAANPTIETAFRIARALGEDVTAVFEDEVQGYIMAAFEEGLRLNGSAEPTM